MAAGACVRRRESPNPIEDNKLEHARSRHGAADRKASPLGGARGRGSQKIVGDYWWGGLGRVGLRSAAVARDEEDSVDFGK